jgi:hypothetical protein
MLGRFGQDDTAADIHVAINAVRPSRGVVPRVAVLTVTPRTRINSQGMLRR